MATTNLGRVRFNMRGDYNPAANPLYSLLDLVSDGGGSFVYINDTPSNEPTSSTSHWQQIAEKGLKGDQGNQGNQGNQGPKGDPGEVSQAQMTAAIGAAISPVTSQLDAIAPKIGYRLINSVTLAEPATSIDFTLDSLGAAFNLKEFALIFEIPAITEVGATSFGNIAIRHATEPNAYANVTKYNGLLSNSAGEVKYGYAICRYIGRWTSRFRDVTTTSINAVFSEIVNDGFRATSAYLGSTNKVRVIPNAAVSFVAGTKVELWGVDA